MNKITIKADTICSECIHIHKVICKYQTLNMINERSAHHLLKNEYTLHERYLCYMLSFKHEQIINPSKFIFSYNNVLYKYDNTNISKIDYLYKECSNCKSCLCIICEKQIALSDGLCEKCRENKCPTCKKDKLGQNICKKCLCIGCGKSQRLAGKMCANCGGEGAINGCIYESCRNYFSGSSMTCPNQSCKLAPKICKVNKRKK